MERTPGVVRLTLLSCLGAIALAVFAKTAEAQYFRNTISDLDPSVMLIDEAKFLGAKLDGRTPLIDSDGKEFPLSDMLGQPLILVLAYYTCDGSCSVIGQILAGLLADTTRVRPGGDFRVLTLSFDRHDNLKTAGAFKRHSGITSDFGNYWALATFKHEKDLKEQTARIGFKFFWSPQDKIFLHPGAFLFLSPEGRLIRVLYPPNVSAADVELAVLDAKQGQFRPSEIINFAVSLCYSYSYADGKYVLNTPIAVGFGALFFGLASLLVSITVFKRKKREPSGDRKNVLVA